MSTTMFVPPIFLTEYPEEDDMYSTLLDRMNEENTGKLLKTLVLEESMKSFEATLQNMNKSYQKAMTSFSKLNDLVDDFHNEDFLDRTEMLYGPVLSSNLSYALNTLRKLLNIFSLGIRQWPLIPDQTKRSSINELRDKFREISISEDNTLPDAIQVAERDSEEYGMAILLFNIMLFMTMTMFISFLVTKEPSLGEEKIDELERLLRDWAQETLTQLTLLGEANNAPSEASPLRGIIADSEDKEITGSVFSSSVDKEVG